MGTTLVEESGIVGRWETEARIALALEGYLELVAIDGTLDYQGWGCILARGDYRVAANARWAVLSWGYGSCSGCDLYEDKPLADVVAEMRGIVEKFATEEEARACFVGSKGW